MCFVPDDATDIEDQLSKSDKAMYNAKGQGKNQIYSHNADPIDLHGE